jgi:hypothetical protein
MVLTLFGMDASFKTAMDGSLVRYYYFHKILTLGMPTNQCFLDTEVSFKTATDGP